MSENKKYYYMKLKENFFTSERMVVLEMMPDGILYSNLLLKMYLMSLKHNGILLLHENLPHTPQTIATFTRHQIGTVERALQIFLKLGFVELLTDGAYYMPDIQLLVGRSSTEAERKRREKDYQSCQHYISQAVDQLARLKQHWMNQNSDSRESVETRQRIQQQTELITALLAEIRELENDFSRQDDSATRQAQEEASHEYDEYQEQQQDAQHRFSRDQRLSSDERNELKRLWRQASRLCHPDVVADDLKEKAHQMMVQLNQARQNADLAAVRALLTQLQSGLEPMMASDRLNDLQHLRSKIQQLREHINALLKEITELEAENAWRLATSVTDKEAYFFDQQRALTEIRNTLEQQVQQVEQELLAG